MASLADPCTTRRVPRRLRPPSPPRASTRLGARAFRAPPSTQPRRSGETRRAPRPARAAARDRDATETRPRPAIDVTRAERTLATRDAILSERERRDRARCVRARPRSARSLVDGSPRCARRRLALIASAIVPRHRDTDRRARSRRRSNLVSNSSSRARSRRPRARDAHSNRFARARRSCRWDSTAREDAKSCRRRRCRSSPSTGVRGG